ncbi:MAG: phosphotransferase [Myxococcota bacterium]
MKPWQPEVALGLDDVRRRLDAEQPDLRGAPLSVLGQGFDSLAVRVGGEGVPHDIVFRFTRRALAARLMVREIRWTPWLQPRLPVPISASVRWALPSEAEPLPYAGHRWLDGTTGCRAALAPAATRRLAEDVGRFLAALHALPLPDDAPPDVISRSDAVHRGTRALQRLTERLPADEGAAVRAAIVPRLGVAPRRAPPTWVHGDVYGRHLLVDEPSGALRGVIDWGDVHAGDPAIDLSIAWSLFTGDDRAALLAAYGTPVDPDAADRARLVAFDYAGALILYGEDVGDAPAAALGWRALRCALAP